MAFFDKMSCFHLKQVTIQFNSNISCIKEVLGQVSVGDFKGGEHWLFWDEVNQLQVSSVCKKSNSYVASNQCMSEKNTRNSSICSHTFNGKKGMTHSSHYVKHGLSDYNHDILVKRNGKQILLRGHTEIVSHVNFINDDTIVSCGYDNKLIIWNIQIPDKDLPSHTEIEINLTEKPEESIYLPSQDCIIVRFYESRNLVVLNLNEARELAKMSLFEVFKKTVLPLDIANELVSLTTASQFMSYL